MIDSCKILGIDIDKESRRQFARVKCLYCNKERDVRIDTFKKKGGCPYCCGHIENSFYYDNPYLKLYDENKKEINTKFIYKKTDKKYYIKCDKCEMLSTRLKNIKGKFSCEYCSDGIPITEKFIIYLFKQLKINFITQYIPTWSENKRYDFYIPNLNVIIETHGGQHYEECKLTNRSLKEEQENDRHKEELALNNGVENYIIIDCRYSTFEWLKKNTIKELNNVFDLNHINWAKLWTDCQSSLVIRVWELWNEGLDIIAIGEIVNLENTTVRKYIKTGRDLGKCVYDEKKQKRKCQDATKVKIIRLNDGKIFDSIHLASLETGIDSSSISKCCNKKRKSAGIFNGEKCKWEYFKE